MQRLFSEVDRVWTGVTTYGEGLLARFTWPAVDYFEQSGKLVIRADVPGIRSEDLHVFVDDGLIRIGGERRTDLQRSDGGVFRFERSYGVFERTLEIPRGVDPDTVQAQFDSGVLEITMPAPVPQPKGRAVPIRTGKNGIAS
jgi:HSP20 family protein